MTMRLVILSSLLAVTVACNQAPNTAEQATPGGAPAEQAAPAAVPTTTNPASAASVPSAGSAGASSRAASSSAPAAKSAANAVRDQAPPKPTMMELEVPVGTPLEITLDTPVSSATSREEDAVRGTVAKAVEIGGMAAIPVGSPVSGTVVEATPSGRVKGLASIAIRFNRVTVANTPYTIRTARIAREAEATKGEDAKKVGIGAGAGAVIGAIAGGKKGAAIGTAVGGGAGAGAVMATKGKEVSIGAGTLVRTRFDEAIRINAPM
jgi:hypothetical protein